MKKWRKNRLELLDDILSLNNSMDLDFWGFDSYFYDDYPSLHYNNRDHDLEFDYKYIDNNQSVKSLSSSGRFIGAGYERGKYIDMYSIYSNDRIREKRINYLLGLELDDAALVTTLSDIFPERFKSL